MEDFDMKKSVIIVFVAALVFIASACPAEIITIAISGTVTSVDDSANLLNGKIATGSVMTGSYTYNTNIAPSYSDEFTTIYTFNAQPYGITLDIDGIIFGADPVTPELKLALTNDAFPTGEDAYILSSHQNQTILDDIGIESIRWQLGDDTGEALSGLTLPVTAPILSDWGSRNLISINSDKIGTNYDEFYITLEITSATLVPEPTFIGLLSLGGLLAIRRR